ncbi:hypothetical protein Dimus_014085 [Dionaea muscipula]
MYGHENKGLSAAFNLLEAAKKEIDSYSKGGPIAYADLIQLEALTEFSSYNTMHLTIVKDTFLPAAIRKCGGNAEKGKLVYTAYGSTQGILMVTTLYFYTCHMATISLGLVR